jgi:hypothetical protein
MQSDPTRQVYSLLGGMLYLILDRQHLSDTWHSLFVSSMVFHTPVVGEDHGLDVSRTVDENCRLGGCFEVARED